MLSMAPCGELSSNSANAGALLAATAAKAATPLLNKVRRSTPSTAILSLDACLQFAMHRNARTGTARSSNRAVLASICSSLIVTTDRLATVDEVSTSLQQHSLSFVRLQRCVHCVIIVHPPSHVASSCLACCSYAIRQAGYAATTIRRSLQQLSGLLPAHTGLLALLNCLYHDVFILLLLQS
jgi:hypothetical protein